MKKSLLPFHANSWMFPDCFTRPIHECLQTHSSDKFKNVSKLIPQTISWMSPSMSPRQHHECFQRACLEFLWLHSGNVTVNDSFQNMTRRISSGNSHEITPRFPRRVVRPSSSSVAYAYYHAGPPERSAPRKTRNEASLWGWPAEDWSASPLSKRTLARINLWQMRTEL